MVDPIAVVELVIKVSKSIYDCAQEVKAFKNRSETLAKRVSVIIRPIEVLQEELEAGRLKIEQGDRGAAAPSWNIAALRKKYKAARLKRNRGDHGNGAEDGIHSNGGAADPALLMEPLKDLAGCLNQALKFMEELRALGTFDRWKTRNEITEKFDHLNAQITSLERSLTLCLQIHLKGLFSDEMRKQTKETFDCLEVIKQNQQDLEADIKELEKMHETTSETNDIVKRLEQKIAAMQAEISRVDNLSGNDLDYLEIPFKDLTNQEFVSLGSYCQIYTTMLGREKKLLKIFDKKGYTTQELAEEMKRWRRLRYSEFVVQLTGYSISDEGACCFVLEYMSLGTLRGVLREKDRHNLTWKRRIHMALDCAQGLYTIHCGQIKPLLHKAVNSYRFLVNEDYRVKITDNGLVEPTSVLAVIPTLGMEAKEEVEYLCPEKVMNRNYKTTIKSEMYRLGVVLYEIASCMAPYESLEDETIWDRGAKWRRDVEAFIRSGKVEEPPADTPPEFKELLSALRNSEPSARPTTGEVVHSLMNLLDKTYQTSSTP